MPKTPARAALEAALRDVVIPELRQRGFRGSFPHYRRILPTRIDLLTFQFYSAGGSFVVEVAKCGPEGPTRPSGVIAPARATAWDVLHRLRLGSDPGQGRADHWFEFGRPSYEPAGDLVEAPEHYLRIARHVEELIRTQAETYWAG
jgi:hypothetical protein